MLFLFASDLPQASELAGLTLPTTAALQEENQDLRETNESLEEYLQTQNDEITELKNRVRAVYREMNEAIDAFLQGLHDLEVPGGISQYIQPLNAAKQHIRETLVD